MKITIDKHFVKGGGIVEVRWNCTGCDFPTLFIQTGKKQSQMQIPTVGSKKLKMKGGSLINLFAVSGIVNGKQEIEKSVLFVLGKQKETDEFEYVGNNPMRDRFAFWWKGVKSKFDMIPAEKKRLYAILFLILIYQSVLPYSYPVASIIMCLVVCYILWHLWRR